MKSISLLGATGTVGDAVLSVIRQHRDLFQLHTIIAGQNVSKLVQIAREFDVRTIAIADEKQYKTLKDALPGFAGTILAGAEGVLSAAAQKVDITVAAITGIEGLSPIMASLPASKVLALANKEALICGGDLLLEAAKVQGTRILPLDSEHNAIFQSLQGKKTEVDRLILTASGGPFRMKTRAEMAKVGVQDALAHPVWKMGEKISIDSATMMNKGLELIEAAWLFGFPSEKIDILIHPQSIIHSMVAYCDGSILAQLGRADMQIPVAHVLAWPDRIALPDCHLSFEKIAALEFEQPCTEKFPALDLARHACQVGQNLPIILNAANEIAVAAFLQEKIGFLEIVDHIGEILYTSSQQAVESLARIYEIDQETRRKSREILGLGGH